MRGQTCGFKTDQNHSCSGVQYMNLMGNACSKDQTFLLCVLQQQRSHRLAENCRGTAMFCTPVSSSRSISAPAGTKSKCSAPAALRIQAAHLLELALQASSDTHCWCRSPFQRALCLFSSPGSQWSQSCHQRASGVSTRPGGCQHIMVWLFAQLQPSPYRHNGSPENSLHSGALGSGTAAACTVADRFGSSWTDLPCLHLQDSAKQ